MRKIWTTEDREKLRQMRVEERLSLEEIGQIYGISRERVRQLIGNTGRIKLARVQKRWNAVLEQSRAGQPAEQIAVELGLHAKSVQRIINSVTATA